MDVAAISGALSAAKNAFDLLKTAAQSRDDAKINEALRALNDRIIDIQNSALQLQEKLAARHEECETLKNDARQIKAHLVDLESQRHQRAQYSLHELSSGIFVLAPNARHESPAPAHYLCQPCMDNAAKKVVLQRAEDFTAINLVCNECKAVYFTGERKEREPLTSRGDYDPFEALGRRRNW
jgi:hypothetical protein